MTNSDNGFADFWQNYPKKKNKLHARKVWCKLKPDQCLQAKIHAKIREYLDAGEWVRGGQFVPYPASWLNAGGWDDEVCMQRYDRQTNNPGKIQRAKIAYLNSRKSA